MKRHVVAVACGLMLATHPLSAAVLFVDPMGSDDNPGTAVQPLRRLGTAAARAQGGDMVVVRPGIYTETVPLTRAGTAESSIVLRGLPGAIMESPDPARSLSGFDVAGTAAHVIIEGFELRGGYAETVFVRPGAHDIELAGLDIHHNRTGVWIAGARDVRVRDVAIHHNVRTGVRIFAGAQRVQVLDTRVEANDDGLGCRGDSDGVSADTGTADVRLERVTANANSEDGFDLQTPTVTVLQSVARDNGCSGIKLAAGGYVENVLVERSATGINIFGGAGELTLIRNATLVDNALGVRAGGEGYGLHFENSIVTGPGKALSYAAAVALTERYNLLYRPLAKDRLIVRVDGTEERRYSGNDVNAGQWQRDSGQGEGTVYAEPRLVPDRCDPLADSPAIDSGGPEVFVPVDLTGASRPAGLGADRGAFERPVLQPDLRIRRAVVRPDNRGGGRLSMYLEMRLPSGARFVPATDAATVAVRGQRGDVARIGIAALSSEGPRKVGARLQVVTGESRARLHVVNDGVRVRIWLNANDARLWVVDAGSVEVTVTLGAVRAVAGSVLRYGR